MERCSSRPRTSAALRVPEISQHSQGCINCSSSLCNIVDIRIDSRRALTTNVGHTTTGPGRHMLALSSLGEGHVTECVAAHGQAVRRKPNGHALLVGAQQQTSLLVYCTRLVKCSVTADHDSQKSVTLSGVYSVSPGTVAKRVRGNKQDQHPNILSAAQSML